MRHSRSAIGPSVLVVCALTAVAAQQDPPAGGVRFAVSFPAALANEPLDGRLVLMLSTDETAEPRFQILDGPTTQQAFGVDVEHWRPGHRRGPRRQAVGYPRESLADVPPGTYTVQALLHGTRRSPRGWPSVKLPMDRGEGQQWNRAPGNLYSAPKRMTITTRRAGDGRRSRSTRRSRRFPSRQDTKYIKHVRIQSERLTKFWGRADVSRRARPVAGRLRRASGRALSARDQPRSFPGHFDGFREEPPDPTLKCEYSERFHLECYNRIEQQFAHQFYKDWTGPDFPRFLIIEIQHANPFYDDSYAVNSANVGPYGDAITYELIPEIEKRFRALGRDGRDSCTADRPAGGRRSARRCSIRRNTTAAGRRVPIRSISAPTPSSTSIATRTRITWIPPGSARRGRACATGSATSARRSKRRTAASWCLAPRRRSGQQWDIWEAVFSPVGADGYPKRIFDKRQARSIAAVADYWKEHYDLSYILQRDWNKGLGAKLAGKINIYVGDMDNYYLNNAVYLIEDVLKKATNPPYGGEIDYGDRAEHCWNGDHTRPNAESRAALSPDVRAKNRRTDSQSAPPGADLASWRY